METIRTYTRFAAVIRPRACLLDAEDKPDPETYAHAGHWFTFGYYLLFRFVDTNERESYEETKLAGRWRYSVLAHPDGDGWLVIEPWLAAWDQNDGNGEGVSVDQVLDQIDHCDEKCRHYRVRLVPNEHAQEQERARQARKALELAPKTPAAEEPEQNADKAPPTVTKRPRAMEEALALLNHSGAAEQSNPTTEHASGPAKTDTSPELTDDM